MEQLARQVVAPNPVGDEFDRLKSLLFRSEARRLGEIETALGALDHRVGTSDGLVLATTEVLVEALRRAEVAQHRELAQALAPVVVACIRNEIKNSKDMMVEALYPITGRLVSAGIAVALAELAAAINARMDNLLSADMVKLRLQSWRSGRPLSELALIRAQRGKLVRLLYLERGSGHLLGQWQADHGQDERADLISGMIAALTDFARNALGTSGGELRELDLGGRKIYLRTSSQMIVAAEFLGELAPGQERRLNEGFLNLLDAGTATPEQALAGLAQVLAQAGPAMAKSKSRLSPVAVIGLVLAAAMAWFAWQSFRHWRQESAIDSALHRVIAAHPELAAYPLRAETQHGAAHVTLSGLVPSLEDKDALEAGVKLAALPYAFASSVAIIGTQRSVDAVADAHAAADGRASAAEAKTAAMGRQLASDLAKLKAMLAERIGGEISGLSGRLAQLGLDLEATRARLSGETGQAVRSAQLQIMDEMASATTAMDERLARLDAKANALDARLAEDIAATRRELGAQVGGEAKTLSDKLASLRGDLDAAQQRLALENAAMARASGEAIASANTATAERLAGLHTKASALDARLTEVNAATRSELGAQVRREADALSDRLGALRGDFDAAQQRLALENAAMAQASTDALASASAAMGGRLAGLDAQASALQARLVQDNAAIRSQWSAQLQREIGTLSDRLVSLRGDLDAAQQRLALENAAMAQASAKAIGGISQRLDVPRARLDEELRGFAVFFLANDAIADLGPVLDRLKTIAKLANAAGGIRVVGYSDETGTPARNKIVARSRAQGVAQRLIEAGMDARHVVIVSRADQGPLADIGDPTNLRNRRVTLEPLYDNEIAP